MIREPISLWAGVAPACPVFAPADGQLDAEVAIVGGGITGVSAALALTRAGQSVVLLEEQRIGHGASGRNAGFVVPHFSRVGPQEVRRLLGGERAEALLRLVGSSADRLFEQAREFGIGDAAEQTGWLQPAHSAQMGETLRARAEAWQALGRPVRFLDQAETAERCGLTRYHGALEDRSGGMVDPMAYLRGLARAAAEAGASLHEQSAVQSLAQTTEGWQLRTARASIRARRVLLATNASTGGVAGRLGRMVVPLTVYQVATDPLSPGEVRRIAPHRMPVSDTRDNIFTWRLDAENRLISGGMAVIPVAAEARIARSIAQRLAKELPLDRTPRVDHVWRGTAAMTVDGLPKLVRFDWDLYGVTGCNGRGVAFLNAMGAAMAPLLGGKATADDLPLPVTKARQLPFHALSRLAPPVMLMRALLSDRLAEWGNGSLANRLQ